jgi:hypothetical protein
MTTSQEGSFSGHTLWVADAAGATLYLRGFYQRMQDSKQAARAEKAGKGVQEQFARLSPRATQHLNAAVERLAQVEKDLGDFESEYQAWSKALHGLMAIAIWADIADALQDPPRITTVGRKANRALIAALEGIRTAFPEDRMKLLTQDVYEKVIPDALEHLEGFLNEEGIEKAGLLGVLEPQIRSSVAGLLHPLVDSEP